MTVSFVDETQNQRINAIRETFRSLRPVDMEKVRSMTDIVEKVESIWQEVRLLLDTDAIADYQPLGEGLQNLFANVFTGLVLALQDCSGMNVPDASEVVRSIEGLASRMRKLVDTLDACWPWLKNEAGLFDQADLREAVEEYRRGEFLDPEEFARGLEI
jgi:hypothetical protein